MTFHQYAGAWPVMPTPYDSEMQVDHGVYREMLAWYLAHGVGGIYALCLSSDMYLLSDEERLSLVRGAVAAANGRVPVAATGNLGATIGEHVARCRRVADAGADVVMLVVPEFCANDEELLAYYLDIAEQVPGPLGLYECPVPRAYHLGVELVRALANTGRFVAFKETSCDLDKIRAILQATAGTPLALLQANTPYLLEAVRAGAPGSMSIATNWVPELVGAVIRQAQSPEADRLQAHLCELEMVERQLRPLGLRLLLACRGLPIQMHTRVNAPPLPAEVLRALDYCASRWFAPDGALNMA
jgi:4-hydroxy-tetrahydrodipicolinate synthase